MMFLHHAWNLYRLFWLNNGSIAVCVHLGALFVGACAVHTHRESRKMYHHRTRLARGDYWNRNHPEDDNGTH